MACLEKCHVSAISIQDDLKFYNALIDTKKCVNCGLCAKVCPRKNESVAIQPRWWYQGWADPELRKCASSGGVASALIRTFILQGGYVASCLFNKGEFRFEVTNDVNTARRFAGSKYVKSNPAGIYEKVQSLLKSNKKVLFIGLPCQVAAIKAFIKDTNNLVTVDLICHGTPSPRLLTKCLSEYGYTINNLSNVTFRSKNQYKLGTNNKPVAAFHTMDNYLIAFLHSMDYTENCYSCDYATLKRVSDITLGDSWGTDLKHEEKKGVSLILCQTETGKNLVENSELELLDVDFENAVLHNEQLNKPSKCSVFREQFFSNYEKKHHFGQAIFMTAPVLVAKEKIKAVIKYAISTI